MRLILVISLCSALAALSVRAEEGHDSCGVSVSWSDPASSIGSVAYNLGQFTAGEDDAAPIHHEFQHKDTGLFAIVDMDYRRDLFLRHSPLYLRLSVTVQSSESPRLSGEARASEAYLPWGRHGYLTVAQELVFNKDLYRFTVSCKGSGFRPPADRQQSAVPSCR